MKFTAKAKDIRTAISRVMPCVTAKEYAPLSDMVLLKMDSKKLSVVAGNGRLVAVAKVHGVHECPDFTIAMIPGDLSAMMGSCPEEEPLMRVETVSESRCRLVIENGENSWKLGGMTDCSKHPAMSAPNPEYHSTEEMPAGWVTEILKKASTFAKKPDTLTDKNIDQVLVSGGFVVATDRMRMVIYKRGDGVGKNASPDVEVPIAAIMAADAMDDGDSCLFHAGNSFLKFEYASGSITSPLVAGAVFPRSWPHLVPADSPTTFYCHLKDSRANGKVVPGLLGSVSRMLQMAGEGGMVKLITAGDGFLRVEAVSGRTDPKGNPFPGHGSFENVPIHDSRGINTEFKAGFTSTLADTLKAMNADELSLSLNKANTPMVLEAINNGGGWGMKVLVMPEMLPNY